MNIALWVVASVLAAAFLAAGMMKLTTDRSKLAEKMPWVTSATDAQVKAIGAAEVLGAIGLILPAAIGVAPILVPVAALCLAMLMVGAAVVHLRLGEGIAAAAPALVLGALSLFVAVMRFGSYSF